MKIRYIRKFRFIRVVFFTLSIIFSYLVVFFIRHFIPHFLYNKLLRKKNIKISKKIKNYFFRLQGIYIKVGQFLSVVANIFAPEITHHLKELQDRVPPRDYESLKTVFLREWGKLPQDIFTVFKPVPIASASLSQVYYAVYYGKEVAIKVLYPEIKVIIEKDLQILKTVIGLIEFFFPFLDLGMLYNEFAEMILKEVDFNYEKANIIRLKKLFSKEEDKIIIPNFIPEISIGDILVTDYIEGYKIDEIKSLQQNNQDPKMIARLLLDAYSEMIFQYGFFHSDPHPGNLIVTPTGKIGIIDFGSADTISTESIRIIRKLLRAFMFKDIAMFVQHIEHLGFLQPTADKEEIEKIVFFILQRLSAFEVKDYQRMTLNEIYKIYNLKVLGVKIQQLLKHLQIPRNYLFLGRTISILLGVVSKLDDKINIIQILLPHLRKFLLNKKNSIKDLIKEDIKTNIHYISQLPETLHRSLETINSGRIKVNLKELKGDIKKLYLLGHQFIYTLLLIAFISFSIIFHLNNNINYSQFFGIGAASFGVLLLISFFRNRKL